MIRLPTAAVTALRDRLHDRGGRPSISVPTTPDELPDAVIADQYGPLCEAMYLMMSADQKITGSERDVIRGAMRELDDRIRSRHIDAMLASSAEALGRDGLATRLKILGESLAADRERAEAAVLLACAVAYADDEIVEAEHRVMGGLLEVLGVDRDRMRQLVASLERVDTVLERDRDVDSADIVVHAAMRLRTPEDFERLAASTDRPDVTMVLRLYAAYVHACDDLLDRATCPRSISTAAVAALRVFAGELLVERSPRLGELRKAVTDVASALERIDRAPHLRAVLDDDETPGPAAALEVAVWRLSSFVTQSLARTRTAQAVIPPRASRLPAAVDDVVSGSAGAAAALERAIDLSWASASIPSMILATVRQVLERLSSLPREKARAVVVDDPLALPEWLPKTRTLAGWYVERALGQGGAGSVFQVTRSEERDDEAAPRYALKVPHYDAVAARSLSESEYLRVFKTEAGALLALPDHPNLAEFVTFDARARPKPLLVMELIAGVDCHALLQSGALDGARIVTILDGVLAGLSAMHEAGVGHLDVKPSNVVLRKTGEAVLVDFGLAGRNLRVGCATPMYAAPEVWGHVEDGVSPCTADVYSFGCVTYELLTGERLFQAPHAMALMAAHFDHDGKPSGVAQLCADASLGPVGDVLVSCLRKSGRQRPTAAALRGQLKELAPLITSTKWPAAAR
ncbi:MAG: serine/threonine-protein kinase [Polyangiales bacterium]